MVEEQVLPVRGMGEDGLADSLPQMSQTDVMRLLLSEDDERSQEEPEVAASIGEQMLHMDIPLLPKSVRTRIRDVCSRVSSRNAIIVGGGIGHLSAWLFDLWCPEGVEDGDQSENRPGTLTIIEPGGRFGVIIDRLIRRYQSDSWARVVSMNWQEVFAESKSSIASNIALPESALDSLLKMPVDLIVIDLPEEERIEAAISAFELVSPGGLVLVLEPTVPTGDVGDVGEGGPTPAQSKVQSFNQWIELVKMVNQTHTLGFAELSGGSLVALLKSQ
tara:strand:+ start:2535 stop:3359 length:825 start_codon:yes stop_codon:yes gene_type:complete